MEEVRTSLFSSWIIQKRKAKPWKEHAKNQDGQEASTKEFSEVAKLDLCGGKHFLSITDHLMKLFL